jgi:hypothetical protein
MRALHVLPDRPASRMSFLIVPLSGCITVEILDADGGLLD